jgi:hypothetical protein
MLRVGYDVCSVQKLMGRTTMNYVEATSDPGIGVRSPLDRSGTRLRTPRRRFIRERRSPIRRARKPKDEEMCGLSAIGSFVLRCDFCDDLLVRTGEIRDRVMS